ncbi:MAG: SDR family NAD(P)-dependent oxidoreductase [Sphingomonas sp.]|nr:SDR family NAD(P)-dependent oxidoreductase [Sphingomonas sp.]
MAKLALVTGVGGGTGVSIVRRFARAGYRVAMLARDPARLADYAREIADTLAYPVDVGDAPGFAAVLDRVTAEQGVPDVVIHNAVAATFARFDAVTIETFERNFRVNASALLQLAQAFAPAMVARGAGAIIVTGNTASLRGVPTYAGFAPTKAAQRILAQALAKDLGPQRVHVANVVIDGPIAAPWLAGPDGRHPFKPPADSPYAYEDHFAQPDAIADEVFHIAHQHPSVWSFDHVIRPFTERWTLN